MIGKIFKAIAKAFGPEKKDVERIGQFMLTGGIPSVKRQGGRHMYECNTGVDCKDCIGGCEQNLEQSELKTETFNEVEDPDKKVTIASA